jgi:hypothetical protein
MTQPDEGPATLADVKLQLQLGDTVDDTFVQSCVDATNALVRTMRVAQLPDVVEPVEPVWPAYVVRGANMLAARLVRRRNSPSGVEAMTDQGAAYVSRNDPDIAQLLQLGTYAKPSVG